MPLQNRVLPNGDIVAIPERGTLMGNRGGALHDAAKSLGRRRWITRTWICCALEFKMRRRTVMAPRRYTELFFLDEATALAAGHRPCFECRHQAAGLFAHLWPGRVMGLPRPSAAAIDDTLHDERVEPDGSKRHHTSPLHRLPMGAIYLDDETAGPRLVVPHSTLQWTPSGYADPRSRRPFDNQVVAVLTPPSTLAVLAAGYLPLLHPSATLAP